MHFSNDLVLLSAIATIATNVLLIECSKSNINVVDQRKTKNYVNNKNNNRNQLIIFDPQSGREIEATQFLPILMGNKGKEPPSSKPNGNLIELPQLWNPCTCLNLLCMCCLGIRLGSNANRVCIAVEYNSLQVSLELRITYNRRIIAQFVFSVRNPPAYCIPILMPLPVFGCLRLYNIRAINGNVQMCLLLMLNVFANTIFQFNFDCIRFGVNGVRFFKGGQMEMETSLEEDDDEMILKGDEEERRLNIVLEENYSGISVESQEEEVQQRNLGGAPILRKSGKG